jgi:hypothetical protein
MKSCRSDFTIGRKHMTKEKKREVRRREQEKEDERHEGYMRTLKGREINREWREGYQNDL